MARSQTRKAKGPCWIEGPSEFASPAPVVVIEEAAVFLSSCNWRLPCQAFRAVQYSKGQVSRLSAIIATAPSHVDLVVDMNTDITMGAPSLQIKSMRDITAFRCVSSYFAGSFSWIAAVANVGTQSRSMEMRFATRDSLSTTPRANIMRKTASLNSPTANGLGGCSGFLDSEGTSSPSWPSLVMMTAQQEQARITTRRLIATVVRRVWRREGPWSTHRPSEEAKTMRAKLVVMPLKSQSGYNNIRQFIAMLTSKRQH